LQFNIPIDTVPPLDVQDAAATLFRKVNEHKQRKLWGRISVEVVMEMGIPSKVTVTTSEVYSEKDLNAKKLREGTQA
jgi:hypothetical protein